MCVENDISPHKLDSSLTGLSTAPFIWDVIGIPCTVDYIPSQNVFSPSPHPHGRLSGEADRASMENTPETI
jgi:hypothetical protein